MPPAQTSLSSLSDPAFEGDAGGTDQPVEVNTPGALSAAVRAILAGRTPAAGGPSLLGPGTGVVQVELRASGRLVGSGWSKGSDYWEGLCQALGALRQQPSTTAANELMLSLGGRSRELPLADEAAWQRLESNRWRGLFGYEIRLVRDPALVVLISPFDFVASNRSFIKILGNSIEPWGLTVEEARAGGVTLSEFETRRFRIDLGRDDAPVVPLVRGTRLVPLEEVTLASVATLQETPQRLSRPLGPGRRADGLPVPPQPRLRRPDPQ